MKIGVKINPIPERLDGRDNTGRKRAPSQDFQPQGDPYDR
jgi:hypothetical protein